MNGLEQVRLRDELFGARSVPITTAQLVSRYNAALEFLGLPRTRLTRFRIDAIGWSAEVAKEQGSADYLWGGLAAPLAVLITPAQAHTEALLPLYSFERLILQDYFRSCGEAVADATSDAWLVLEADTSFSCYKSPSDLALLQSLVVRSSAGELTAAAKQQRLLVERFQTEPLGWYDPRLRRALIESAERWGDLRQRRVLIPDVTFSDTTIYYTRHFGGIYVLRGLRRDKQLFVFEDEAQAAAGEGYEAMTVDNHRLARRLFDEGLCTVHLTSYRERPALLEWKLECLAADVVCAEEPEGRFASLNPLQRRRALAALGDRLPPVFHELECFAGRLASGDPTPLAGLSTAALLLLAEPAHAQSRGAREALWQLLARLDPRDVVLLARHHPGWFYECYRDWPPSKRAWARHAISQRIFLRPECSGDEFPAKLAVQREEAL